MYNSPVSNASNQPELPTARLTRAVENASLAVARLENTADRLVGYGSSSSGQGQVGAGSQLAAVPNSVADVIDSLSGQLASLTERADVALARIEARF